MAICVVSVFLEEPELNCYCISSIKMIYLTSRHLLCKERDELCEVDGSGRLGQHVGRVAVADGLAHGREGGLQVGGGDDAVLVRVHDAERLLELLDLLLGEEGEDVAAAPLRLSAKLRQFRYVLRTIPMQLKIAVNITYKVKSYLLGSGSLLRRLKKELFSKLCMSLMYQ